MWRECNLEKRRARTHTTQEEICEHGVCAYIQYIIIHSCVYRYEYPSETASDARDIASITVRTDLKGMAAGGKRTRVNSMNASDHHHHHSHHHHSHNPMQLMNNDLSYLEAFVNADDFICGQESIDQQQMLNSEDPFELHSMESEFCRNFSCCGLNLRDMHELLQHYEECHVHVLQDTDDEHDGEDAYSSSRQQDDLLSFVPAPPGSPNHIPLSPYQQSTIDGGSPFLEHSNYHLMPDYQHSAQQQHHLPDPLESASNAGDLGVISAFENSIIRQKKPNGAAEECDYPLIRRVGDVEDDLGMRILEIMNEELERGGKRLKMLMEDERQEKNYVVVDVCADGTIGDDGDYIISEGVQLSEINDPNNLIKKSSKRRRDNANSDDEVDGSCGGSVSGDEEQLKMHKQQPSDVTAVTASGGSVEKPYRCTFPGCDKAYKNPNGLKYHNLHGHCGGEDEELDLASRLMKPYVCNFKSCFKRYKNLNGLKYHIEKGHGMNKQEANQLATAIVKKTNSEYGIHSRSVPNNVLFAAMRDRESGGAEDMGGDGPSKQLASLLQQQQQQQQQSSQLSQQQLNNFALSAAAAAAFKQQLVGDAPAGTSLLKAPIPLVPRSTPSQQQSSQKSPANAPAASPATSVAPAPTSAGSTNTGTNRPLTSQPPPFNSTTAALQSLLFSSAAQQLAVATGGANHLLGTALSPAYLQALAASMDMKRQQQTALLLQGLYSQQQQQQQLNNNPPPPASSSSKQQSSKSPSKKAATK